MRTPSSSLVSRGGSALRLFAVLLAIASFVLPSAAFSADAVVATVPVGVDPYAIAVDPVSHQVFVANYGGDSVSVIDGATDAVTATVTIPRPPVSAAAFPIAAVADPLTGRAYIGNFWCNTVSVIDGTTHSIIATITPPLSHGSGVRALALDNSGATTKVYAAIYGKALVSVIDASTNTITKDIPVGDSPRGLAVFASGGRHRVWVANRNSNNVSVIDGATDSVIATVPTGSGPRVIAVDADRGFAYVSSPAADTVTVIDDSDAGTATIAVGDNPIGVAVDSTRRRVFVANYYSNNVSVIDADTLAVVATVATGANPWAVAVDQSAGKAFVSCYGGNSVTVIDDTLATVSVPVGTGPYGLGIDEGLPVHETYAGNWGGDTVSIIDPAEGSGGPVTATVDPFPADTTSLSSPVLTGSAASTREPYGSAVLAVFYRIDDDLKWRRAELTSGQGTPSVRWRAQAGALSPGPHTIRVAAMDQALATAASCEQGTGGSSAALGTPAAYGFGVARYEQTDPDIRYTGAWQTWNHTKASAGSFKRANTAGAAVDIAFNGDSIDYLAMVGPNCGMAAVYLDGAPADTVDFYAPAYGFQRSVFSRSGLATGTHTLRFEALGSANASATGTYVSLDALVAPGGLAPATDPYVTVEQDDGRIYYSAPWELWSSASMSGGSFRRTRMPGRLANVTFSGTSLEWTGVIGPIYGVATVIVDGSVEATVDLYSPTYRSRATIWRVTDLAPGAHSVRIVSTGVRNPAAGDCYVGIDTIRVQGTVTQAPAPYATIEETSTACAYTGSWERWTSTGYSGGAFKRSSALGAAVQVTFTGTGVDWVTLTGPVYGMARVYVDGVLREDAVDLYSLKYAYKQIMFSAHGLPYGTHTLRIERTGLANPAATGSYVGIDALRVW